MQKHLSQPIFTPRPIFKGKPILTQALMIWLQERYLIIIESLNDIIKKIPRQNLSDYAINA